MPKTHERGSGISNGVRTAIVRGLSATALPTALLALAPAAANARASSANQALPNSLSLGAANKILQYRVQHQQPVVECDGQATIPINVDTGGANSEPSVSGGSSSTNTTPAIARITNGFIYDQADPNLFINPATDFKEGDNYDIAGLVPSTPEPRTTSYHVSSTKSFEVSSHCRAVIFGKDSKGDIDPTDPLVVLGLLGSESNDGFGTLKLAEPVGLMTIEPAA